MRVFLVEDGVLSAVGTGTPEIERLAAARRRDPRGRLLRGAARARRDEAVAAREAGLGMDVAPPRR
ncbi:hypothetical protein LUW77_00870 [Streptomyces radiopugnans]|nr:hypothetical protein LUW77_00870 [Streptomyces radiopugnans]